MKKVFPLLCLFVCLFGLGSSLRAQETSGGLTGHVQDSSGHPLPGATITAIHQPSGTRYSTTSTRSGIYSIPNLRIGGPYHIEISYSGMETQTKDGVTITLGDALTEDFVLAPSVRELGSVLVKATRNSARANAFGSGTNISRDNIRQMPTLSRSITDMTKLVPQGSKDNSFAGTNFRYNNVTVDGAINNDAIGFSPSLGGITGTSGMPGSSTRSNPISMDAIEDMQVYLSPFDVKLGGFTGGSINAVTRSGTNTVTGSIYAFGRNAATTGKDRIGDQGKEPSDFHDYQVGFRIGFPLVTSKLFFFTNEELARRQDPIQQNAGSAESSSILSLADAQNLRQYTVQHYGWDPGTYGTFNVYANSDKYFNRLDWNIDSHNQLALRNNTILSKAINLERDQQDFRFGDIAYQQVNNQSSTVLELKTQFNSRWSNSLVAGYTTVHDYRNPSDSIHPQVQILGNTPGTTIYFGTDREAAIFNMKQNSVEVTDNVTLNLGANKLTLGTHNELYHILYNFVNSWNGRVDYNSISDYLNSNPYRVRGSYNYINDSRAYILSNPSAQFNIDLYSAYIQDEIQVNERFKLIPGVRVDEAEVPQKQILSTKTQSAYVDPYFGTTYTYTPLNHIRNDYFNAPQISPRIGFRYDLTADRKLVLRGGTGLFTGRIPFAWLGYSFYNNGDTYGAFDQKASNKAFIAGTDPMVYNPNGISSFIAQNGGNVTSKNAGPTQVDAVNNHLLMPKVWRTSAALDYTDERGFKYSIEGIYTKTLEDITFQQVNIQDNPRYYPYDVNHLQPIFPSTGVDPRFANAYEMSNTKLGYRYSISLTVSREFTGGFGFMAAYTYGRSEDVSNGIRNSMESNWQLNQALNPDNPGLALSNFDIRHRIIADIHYRKAWDRHWVSLLSVFVSAQSGAPFTYGFVNQSIQGTGQQVSLAYIPKESEAINFFQDQLDANGNVTATAASQAAAFNAFIDGNKYLRSRRGQFTERNAAHTPWNTQADFRFAQEYHFGKTQYITLTVDIINLTSLLDKNWGQLYFVPNTYNQTASVGLSPTLFPPQQNQNGYPVYTFMNPGKPYSVDYFNSRYQMQFGIRYSF
ncbi:TonB-dependent receptor [Dinghuibacter silviterrae]|uniref:Carboxypeptidase family protein n=1 Tax=Dinghuibacter silviterrae TaxID=1539049 RepID=A0A4R8DRD9_9BACT|nr:carboxypeptidase regulatory-like domain-containing protein [Dinghuibacter silviterrae]TDX00762.1 carboxypeptidase family protein [Dinghuibacter silviterrae]